MIQSFIFEALDALTDFFEHSFMEKFIRRILALLLEFWKRRANSTVKLRKIGIIFLMQIYKNLILQMEIRIYLRLVGILNRG